MIIRKFLYTCIAILISLACTAKIVNGQIVDSSSGQPISYATVMVNDTLIRMKPVAASIDGRFSIEIPDAIRHVVLQISAIGYETFSYLWDVNDSIIRVHPKSYTLDGVTVSAQRKTIKNIEDGIEVKIKNSPFSEIPKPVEMIKQLPFVDAVSEEIKIMGKRNTVVYINSHKVENMSEINELSSGQIDNVKILTNPGLKYGRDVDAVVIIKTIRSDVGMTGFVSANYEMLRGRSSYGGDAQLTLTNKKGVSVQTGTSYSDDTDKSNLATNEVVPDIYTTDTDGKQSLRKKTFSAVFASFFEDDETSYGVKYRFMRTPSDVTNKEYNHSSLFEDGTKSAGLSKYFSKTDDFRHWVNLYCNRKISSLWTFSSDVNGYIGENHSLYENSMHSDLLNGNLEQTSAYRMEYKLLDCRADLDYTYNKWNISFGAQYTFTSTLQTFDGQESLLQELTTNKQMQSLWAIYASFKLKLSSKWNFMLGARDEIGILNYSLNGMKVNEESGAHNYFTPKANITYHDASFNATASYSYNIYRPGYAFLSNNATIVSPTLYSKGNPFLRNNKEHEFAVSVYWKKTYLYCRYGISLGRMDNAVGYDASQELSFITPFSIRRMANVVALVQQRMDFGIWHPTIMAIMLMQNTKYGTPERTYNKPYLRVQWKNLLSLPCKFNFYPTFYYESTGNTNLYTVRHRFIANMSLSRSFGKLSASISVKDLFNGWKNEYLINTNNMKYRTYNKYGTSFTVELTYDINSAKKRYKGNSTSSELNRL